MPSQDRKVQSNSSEPFSKQQSGNSPDSSLVLSRRVFSQILPGLLNISVNSDGEKAGDNLIDVVIIRDFKTPPKLKLKQQADYVETYKCQCMLPSLKNSVH